MKKCLRFWLCMFFILATIFITVGCSSEPIQRTPGEEFPICTDSSNQVDPSISGDIVAWLDRRNNNSDVHVFDIYGYYLSSGQEFPVYIDSYYKGSLKVGGEISWREYPPGNGACAGSYDMSSGIAHLVCGWYPSEVDLVYRSGNDSVLTCTGEIICEGPIAQHLGICNQSNEPASWVVSGGTLIWQDRRNSNWDIFGYPSSSDQEFAVCTNAGNQSEPAVSGDVVVWHDDRNGNWDIYGYNLSTGAEFPICTSTGNQTSPAISGNTVVWVDDRNGNADIYGVVLAFEE